LIRSGSAAFSFPAALAQGRRNGGTRLGSLINELEKQIPELMRETIVPGVSLILIVQGRPRWRRGFGVKDGSREAVDPDTVFEAASMSKPVFAYAVMKLAEKGVLQLDTPLTRYTPVRFLIGDPRLDLITSRHVLSHATGFPNWRSSRKPLQIEFTPGEKYSYSGEGYYYLQTIVTHLTGHENRAVCSGGYEGDLEVCATDIAAYLDATILGPFGMRSSTYVPNGPLEKRKARPHDKNGQPMNRGNGRVTDPARYAAAGGLLTTPTDYAKFLLEVVNARPSDAHRLTKRSLDEMLRPHVTVSSNDEYTVSWTLGWRLIRAKDGEWIGHGGDNPGFHCLSEVSPVQKTGYVIMTNGEGGPELIQKVGPMISRELYSAS
jgi:CubicO group peptidase (beta-lactamase class C family)